MIKGMSCLLESDLIGPTAIHYCIKMTVLCFQPVNGIEYCLAQSDPIKRHLLYSRYHLMESRLIVSAAYWNQIS
jgi:hypothetical protein